MVKIFIYLDYSNDKHKIIEERCLGKGYEVELVKSITHLNTKTSIIIATNVEFQYHIFKESSKINYYQMFDNKSGFYKYLKENTSLWNGLYLIPHYDKQYNGPNINKNFMVKKNYGFSSAFNEIISGNINDIISKYAATHQIQDIMDVKHIYGVSLSCLSGKILGVYTYKSIEAITKESQLNGFNATRNNYIEYPEVKQFLKKLMQHVLYNGLIEVEFIIDKNKIYIMESNPRISGSSRIPAYFDWIIQPYIDNYCNSSNQISEINLDDKKLWKNA